MANTIKLFCPDCDQKLEVELIPGVRAISCPMCGGRIGIPIIEDSPKSPTESVEDIDFKHLHEVFVNDEVAKNDKHVDFQKFSPEPDSEPKPSKKHDTPKERKNSKHKRSGTRPSSHKKRSRSPRKPIFKQAKSPFDKYARPVIAALVVFVILFGGYKLAMNEINKEKERRESAARAREAEMRLKELKREKEKNKEKNKWNEILRQVQPSKLKTEQEFANAVSLIKNFRNGNANKKVELLMRLKKYRRLRISQIMNELEIDAKALAAEKKYSEALALYQDYSGDFAKETVDIRNKKASRYLDEIDRQSEENKQVAIKVAGDKALVLKGICQDLISSNISGALMEVRHSKFKDDFANVIKNLEDIVNIRTIVKNAFKKRIGKKITFEALNQKHSMVLKKVSISGQLIFESKRGNVELIKKINFQDLSETEKIKALAKYNKTAASIYAGIKAAELRKYDDAKKYFAKSKELASPFATLIGELKKGTFVRKKQEKKTEKVSDDIDFKKVKVDFKITVRDQKIKDKAETYIETINVNASVKNQNTTALSGVLFKIFIIGKATSSKKKHILKVIQSYSKKIYVKPKGFFSKKISFKNTSSQEIELNIQGSTLGMNNAKGYKYYAWLWVICDISGEPLASGSKYEKFKLNPEKIIASRSKEFRDF